MHFTKLGSFHRVSCIAGPTYNLLGVSFADAPSLAKPTIEALPPVTEIRHRQLDPEKILQAVLAGIHAGNEKFNTHYRIAQI